MLNQFIDKNVEYFINKIKKSQEFGCNILTCTPKMNGASTFKDTSVYFVEPDKMKLNIRDDGLIQITAEVSVFIPTSLINDK